MQKLQLPGRLWGQQLINNPVLIIHLQPLFLAHYIALILGRGLGFAGEEPLDGHAQAAGDVEQGGDGGVGEVAFQLADVAGGEFALLGQFAQGQAAAFAQAADAGAKKLRAARGLVVGAGLRCGRAARGRRLAAWVHGGLQAWKAGASGHPSCKGPGV